MSCPNWRSVVAERELTGEDAAAWTEALRHLDDCPDCWERALAADPALLFQRLPAPEISDEDIAGMKQAVATMRRARTIEQPSVQRSRSWGSTRVWQAVAAVAVLALGPWLLRDAWLGTDESPGDIAAKSGVGIVEVHVDSAERPDFVGPEAVASAADPEALPHLKGPRVNPALPEGKGEVSVAAALPATAQPETPATAVAVPLAVAEEDLEIEIQVLRAAAGSQTSARIPEKVEERLRGIFNFDGYELLAGASLKSLQGAEVLRDLGDGYSVRFQLGEILSGGALKLSGFRVLQQVGAVAAKGRQPEPEELIETTLTLSLDQAFILGLAQNANDEEALMVAITCRRAGSDTEP